MHYFQTGRAQLYQAGGINRGLLTACHLQRNQLQRFHHFTSVDLKEWKLTRGRVNKSYGLRATLEPWQGNESLVAHKKRGKILRGYPVNLKLGFENIGRSFGIVQGGL